jgi:hypothetical protein
MPEIGLTVKSCFPKIGQGRQELRGKHTAKTHTEKMPQTFSRNVPRETIIAVPLLITPMALAGFSQQNSVYFKP